MIFDDQTGAPLTGTIVEVLKVVGRVRFTARLQTMRGDAQFVCVQVMTTGDLNVVEWSCPGESEQQFTDRVSQRYEDNGGDTLRDQIAEELRELSA